MFSKTIIIAAAAFMLGVKANSAIVCGDANLGGKDCQNIPDDNKCYNLNNRDWASSFRTNGLTCSFYDNYNCFKLIIGPTKDDNGNLRDGEFNDQINSVRCKKTSR